jgi:hypothetical protein
MQPTRLVAIAAIAVLASCATHSAILFDGMGDHTRKISTANSLAQRYFNQGLAMCYGFNHDEAVRSYQAVADLDPECAMAYWGQAFALSPNINLPMPDANSELAFAAIQKAMECKDGATAAERTEPRGLPMTRTSYSGAVTMPLCVTTEHSSNPIQTNAHTARVSDSFRASERSCSIDLWMMDVEPAGGR